MRCLATTPLRNQGDSLCALDRKFRAVFTVEFHIGNGGNKRLFLCCQGVQFCGNVTWLFGEVQHNWTHRIHLQIFRSVPSLFILKTQRLFANKQKWCNIYWIQLSTLVIVRHMFMYVQPFKIITFPVLKSWLTLALVIYLNIFILINQMSQLIPVWQR